MDREEEEVEAGATEQECHGTEKHLNPIAKVILEGLYDENSELFALNGMWHILKKIWTYVTHFWKSNIKINPEFGNMERDLEKERSYLNLNRRSHIKDDIVTYREWPYTSANLVFPKPTGIQINMMPFVMDSSRDFAKCLLPGYLKTYWENIIRYCPLEDAQLGNIGFLTIQESFVPENTSQRRPGLHTERPGIVRVRVETPRDGNGSEDLDDMEMENGPVLGDGYLIVRRHSFGWGNGVYRPVSEVPDIEGGIYMASNVDDSCRIYNCEIMDDELIGELGDIEHLREYMPEGEVLQKNCIYWFTDRTPHESLPVKKSTKRQFFRLVTSEVSLWYEDHSTKNPLGVVPDPEITKVVKGSKFDRNGVVFSEANCPSSGKKGLKNWFKSLKLK